VEANFSEVRIQDLAWPRSNTYGRASPRQP
jgi:hypothetical protein